MLKPISPLTELNISYGFAVANISSNCLVAWVGDAICFLAFAENNKEKTIALDQLKKCWKNSNFHEDEKEAKVLIAQIFSHTLKEYNLLVHGSDFQIKVWEALMSISHGTTVSYEEIAMKVGGKNYTRASASAIAKNNISYLIPCHRVVSKTGNIHKYRWGGKVKEQLIKWEIE